MAGQPNNTPSQFSARSDRAALALRQSLRQRGEQIPESRSVEVDANGRPPAPLPPDGSYARQAIEQQRQEAARQRPPADSAANDIQMQPQDPQATLESDQADGQPEQQPQSGEPAQLSANAQRRIAQLTDDLRRKDQEFQAILAESKRTKETFSELEAKLNSLQSQHQQVLEQSLANMDPDTRTQILMDGRLAQALAESEDRIMKKIVPALSKMERQSADAEMRRLSSIYPGFNLDVHGPLIETFRQGNPRSTVEQAFKAVAEPEELQLASQVRASAVPPVVQPGNGRIQSRYTEQKARTTPEEELVLEAQQLKKLMSSTDPVDRTSRDRFLHQHLAKRLGHRLPG